LKDQKTDKTGLTISDLHLGQVGSVGHKHLKQLKEFVQKNSPERIFLNGDIIEVDDLTGDKKSILAQIDASLEQLDDFIETAIAANPKVKISYIFGNHDNFYELESRIKKRVERFSPHLEYHESHIKTANTIHLHGDLQTDYPYQTPIDMLKAGFKGNIITNIGVMIRHDAERLTADFPDEFTIEDSLWKELEDKKSFRDLLDKKITFVKNVLDTHLSSIVMPAKQVVKAIFDTISEQQPELLEGVDTIVLGHIHPKGRPILEHEDIKFIFTGPSSLFSKGPAYSFSIEDDGKFSDFQAIDLGRGYQKSGQAHTR